MAEEQERGWWYFRYRADILPTCLFASYFVLDLIIFFSVESVPFLIFWLILGILPKTCVAAYNHHHQHISTFGSTFLNRVLELIFAFQTGIATNGWVLHHVLGHHLNYLDQTKDESRWMRKSGKTMGVIEYSVYTSLMGYPKAIEVGLKHPRQHYPFLYMTGLVILLLGVAFYYNPVNALFVFLLPMIISFYITAWHTYYHHAGLDHDDHFHASYNITHKWYNILTCNLGYHTAHHYKMGVHWSQLPKLHKEIEHKIPKELFREPSLPFAWLPAT